MEAREQELLRDDDAPRSPTILDSFNYAFEGIIHVLRTQRNMRIHFASRSSCSSLALVVDVTKLELIALLISITFVLIAEMINTAIEAAIDIATTSFDPMAKLAKDIAAGAVLIAAVNAVAVGYLVFSGKVADRSSTLLDRLRDAPAELTLVALVLTVIVVIATKACTGRGTPLRGGLPSGHAALAFAGWMAATYVAGADHRFLVSSIALVMALLVAQTRVESGVHSALEVTYGALVGALADARRLPGVLVSDELVRRRPRRSAAKAYAPYSNYLVGAVVRTSDGREFAGVNVENAAYPLGICAEKTAIGAAAAAGYRPGDLAAIGDHRLAVRRLPPVAVRVADRRGRLPRATTARSRTVTPRPSCCRTRGTCPNEVGLRRRRRAAERRQVDARQRAHRREGRDRLATSRTRRATGSAACYTTDDAQLVLVDLPGWQKPIDPLTERMQERVDETIADDLDVVLLVVNARERIGAGDRYVARRVFELGVPVVIVAQQGRPAEARAHRDADEDRGRRSATSTRSIR